VPLVDSLCPLWLSPMEKNLLEFSLPAWWLVPAIALAAGAAYFLYTKPGVPWGKNQNLILGFLRFTGLSLLLLLLLEPIMRRILNEVERPVVVIGVDNSLSVSAVHTPDELRELTENLSRMAETISRKNDYRVEIVSLEGEKEFGFDKGQTDISGFFKKLDEQYDRRTIRGAVLVTDGIYNRGASPEFGVYSFPVFSIGLGDTLKRKDLAIREVRHNRVAYSDNVFPVQALVNVQGYTSGATEIVLSEGGKTLQSQRLDLRDGEQTIDFLVESTKAGLRHLVLTVPIQKDESNLQNNRRDIFIEILESKKKIRIAARAPQPDIKAIRSVLEETGNYEVVVDLPHVDKKNLEGPFDLEILFDGIKPVGGSGRWIINSDPRGAHFQGLPFVAITTRGQWDAVIPSLNGQFSKFKINQNPDVTRRYPPVNVPFGTYQLSGPHEVLLYQRVGNVITDKPLLAVFDDGTQKQAIQMGAGIWQWRLQEAATEGDAKFFKELVQKLVQYLGLTEDKKQFRVSKGQDEFTEGETVFFDVEIYNASYEPLEGQPYSLVITDADGKREPFDYVFGTGNKKAATKRLSAGTYRYRAETSIAGKLHVETGAFAVKALQLEYLNLQANHQVLRQLAYHTDGAYVHVNELEKMEAILSDSDFKGLLYSTTTNQPLIRALWLLLTIALLFSSEWFLRKYWGGY
jgi:hypothetical protein